MGHEYVLASFGIACDKYKGRPACVEVAEAMAELFKDFVPSGGGENAYIYASKVPGA